MFSCRYRRQKSCLWTSRRETISWQHVWILCFYWGIWLFAAEPLNSIWAALITHIMILICRTRGCEGAFLPDKITPMPEWLNSMLFLRERRSVFSMKHIIRIRPICVSPTQFLHILSLSQTWRNRRTFLRVRVMQREWAGNEKSQLYWRSTFHVRAKESAESEMTVWLHSILPS